MNNITYAKMNLSSYMWSKYIEILDKYNWPNIQLIPIKKTLKWFKRLDLNTRQVAQNSLERVLYSLCNYSNGDVTPVNLLWLIHGIESLFCLPTTSIVHHLKNRVFLLLGEPITNKKNIKKLIDEFYILRSKVVHGKFKIFLPEKNEILDKTVLEQVDKLMDKDLIVLTLLIASIQVLVNKDAYELNFEEKLSFKNKRV